MKPLLTIKEAAVRLGLTYTTFHTRYLPRIKYVVLSESGSSKRTIRIPEEELERFIKRCQK